MSTLPAQSTPSTPIPPAPPAQLTPTFKEQLVETLSELRKKFLEGAIIGFACCIAALLDRTGVFTKFINESMTNIPFTVVIAGFLGGYGMVLRNGQANMLASAGAAWLRLIEQFFSLGAGAFWPIQAAVWLNSNAWSIEQTLHWDRSWITFLSFLALAFLAVALDVAQKEKLNNWTKVLGAASSLISFVILIVFLMFFDGEVLTCNVEASIMRRVGEKPRACPSMEFHPFGKESRFAPFKED